MGLHIWLYALMIFNHHTKQLSDILYSIRHMQISLIGPHNNKSISIQEIFNLRNPMEDLNAVLLNSSAIAYQNFNKPLFSGIRNLAQSVVK
jgi:hypothetical protein